MLVKTSEIDDRMANAFYGPVVAGVTQACTDANIDVRIDTIPVGNDSNPTEIPRLLRSPGIDGFVVLGTFLPDATVSLFAKHPVVLVDGYTPHSLTIPSVVSDNRGGARRATEHLIEHGHQVIAFAGSTPQSFPSILERRLGYEDAMAAAGLQTCYLDVEHHDADAAGSRIASSVRGRDDITGIVCSNDAVAIAVVSELADRAVGIPHQLSIVGFDNIDASAIIRPRLDTISVDKLAMGRLSVSLLRHRVEHPSDPVFRVTQAAHLVRRDSVAHPQV